MNVLVAVAEAVIVPVVVMVVVPMVLRGYEIKVKWMALFRDIIFCAFCINIAGYFEIFLLFLANLNEILNVVFFFLEFMLLARFSILSFRRGIFFCIFTTG